MAHGIPLIVDSVKRDLSSVIEWGRQRMLDGAYEAAIQHFTTALNLKPGLMHALVSRGFCHLTLGDEGRAQRDFAEVITKDAGFNRNIYVLIALCCKRSGDYHTAIRYLSRCIAHFAFFKPALIARGELCLKVRDYEKARSDFRQVLNDAPGHLVARRGIADAMRGLGNFREALRQYARALEDADHALAQQQRGGGGREEHGADDEGSNASQDGANTPSSKASELGCITASVEPSIVEVGRGGNSGGDGSEEGSSSSSRASSHGQEQSQRGPPGPDQMACLQDEPLRDPQEVRAFVMDVLLRRALLQRLMGDLEGAGADLLEVLQMDSRHGLALFWYGKVLLEQHRHREAPAFLQASIEHHEETRVPAHALLGALLMTWPCPDCEVALRHLKEAVRLCPSSQPVRITLWLCSAAAALQRQPRDARCALGLLDRALAALTSSTSGGASTARGSRGSPGCPSGGSQSARGPATARIHVAGSGGAAASVLSGGLARSPEDARWSSTRALVRRRQELAQGDDLELALECRTYFQLVARDPQQQVSEVPFLLYLLRTQALVELNRLEEAAADCRKALTINPSDEDVQFTMHIASGILRAQVFEYEAAVGCFTKAVRIQPVSGEARIHRALALAGAAWAQDTDGLSGGLAGTQDPARVAQLLVDAIQDLEAVGQQALIAGTSVPPGAWHLRAACLCSAGRPEEAWEVLQESGRQHAEGRSTSSKALLPWAGSVDSVVQQHTLEAEVLVLLGKHREAVEACTAVLNMNTVGQVEARIMRGCCWSHLGESELAFEDYREALLFAPERRDVHEASGDLFLAHSCLNEAITAFDNAAKLGESMAPRLAYKRALAQLALGNIGPAQKDLSRALRVNPTLPIVSRARDGLAALQAVLEGNYRHAHVRLNMLIHAAAPLGSASDRLPPLFLPHEFMLYRAMCSLYLGDSQAAIQDFGLALELVRKLAAASAPPQHEELPHCLATSSSATSAPASASSSSALAFAREPEAEAARSGIRHSSGESTSAATVARQQRQCLPPEVASPEGLDCFECEVFYNVAICQLAARDYRGALAACEQLLERQEALEALGAQAHCLAWFLVGVCHLATGDARDDLAREAFMRSYAHDPTYVDDFLKRHGRRHEPSVGAGANPPWAPSKAGAAAAASRCRMGGPAAAMRQPGGSARPVVPQAASGREVCDASPDAVCSLRRDRAMFSALLPPCRLQVRDVVIWGRPSIGWPFIRPPELSRPTSLARLDLLQHREVLQRAAVERQGA